MNSACSNCGAKISPGQNWCARCGTRVQVAQNPTPNAIVCQACGNLNKPGNQFCSTCGQPLFLSPFPPPTWQPVASETKNKKSKPVIFTIAISIVLIVCLLVNFIVFPIVNNKYDTNLGFFNDYGKSKPEEKDNNVDKPIKQGKVIAEAVLSEDNYTILAENENVSMNVSSLSFDKSATAKIRETDSPPPFDGIKLKVYDFSLESDKPIEGVITLEIPYDKKDLPVGHSAQECIVGIHFDEETNYWRRSHFEIDETRMMVVISTYHLSLHGYAINSNLSDTPMAGGTVDLSKRQIFTSNEVWEDAPNYGVFYTYPEDDLMENAFRYNLEYAKSKYGLFDNEQIIQNIAYRGTDTTNQTTIDTAMSWLGTMEGFPEHGSKAVLLMDGYRGTKLEAINSSLNHLGGALALFQLASDMYYGKAAAEATFNFFKAMIYYQGATVAEMFFGATAGYFASWAIVGLFVYELIFGPVEHCKYADLPEHKKLFGAVNEYYNTAPKNGGAYRSNNEWFEIISDLNKKALESSDLPEGLSREDYFKQLIHEELDVYVSRFWELSAADRAQKVIANKNGYLYGNWGLVHYEESTAVSLTKEGKITPDKDFQINLWQYVDNLTYIDGHAFSSLEAYLVKQNSTFNQTIGPSSNYNSALAYMNFFDHPDEREYHIYQDIKEELINALRNTLLNKRIRPMMREKQEEIFLRRERELEKKIEVFQAQLNKTIELKYTDESANTLEKPIYAGYIVVPQSKTLHEKQNLADWATVLDKDGKGSIVFTTIAHQRAGAFNKVAVYKPEDKDRLHEATPVLVVDIKIDGDIVDVPIKFDDFTGTYRGLLPLRAAHEKFYTALNATGSTPDQDVYIYIKSDNTVIIEYTFESSFVYSLYGVKFTTESSNDVHLEGTVSSDGVIEMEGKSQGTSRSIAEGPAYEGEFAEVEDTTSIDIIFKGTVEKSDSISGFVIKGTVTHSADGSEVKMKLQADKQVSFD